MTVNFFFPQIDHILVEIGIQYSVSRKNLEHAIVRGEEVLKEDPEAIEAMRQSAEGAAAIVRACEHVFPQFNCSHIDDAIRQLKHWTEDTDRTWYNLNRCADALRRAIRTELKDHLLYRYSKEKWQKLLKWKADWKPAVDSFFEIEIDVFSAVDCYALEHNTASVFHCMRILEHGLAALATDVGLSFDVQQWNTIIEQIEAKIAELRRALPRGTDKNERMQFLSEAAKEFFYFKDGWRNYVSHNRGRYDEHQAAGVLEHTRTFMNHLATCLSEQP